MAQRHLFLRDYTKANKHPVGCVMVETDGATNQIRYALSVCSPLDTWSARVARSISTGRLRKEPVVITCEVPKHNYEITRIVMEHIVKTHGTQQKGTSRSVIAYETARAWLENSKQYTEKQAA